MNPYNTLSPAERLEWLEAAFEDFNAAEDHPATQQNIKD